MAKPFLEFIHPEDRQATIAEGKKLTSGARTVAFENRYLSKDGSYRSFLWAAAPSLEQGLIYGAARDITERKRAEQEINEINVSLERRVMERTAELDQTNQQLHTEIAERAQAEQALAESEERYRL